VRLFLCLNLGEILRFRGKTPVYRLKIRG